MQGKRLLAVIVVAVCAMEMMAQRIAKYEYWIDDGVEQRTVVTNVADSIIMQYDAATLGSGFHTFSFRAADSNGRWTPPITQYFLKAPVHTSVPQPIGTLTRYEYWLDQQHEQRVSMANSNGIIDLRLDADTLATGFHTLSFRMQDSNGRWTPPITQYFLKAPVHTSVPQPIGSLTRYEYWLDQQHEQRVSMANSNGIIDLRFDADTLATGFHTLSFRMQDSNGRWTPPITQYFLKMPKMIMEKKERLISAYRYWYNGATEDARFVRFNQPASPQLLEVQLPTNDLYPTITLDNIATRTHEETGVEELAIRNVLYTHFCDTEGNWSEVQADTFLMPIGNRVVSLTGFIKNPDADNNWTNWTVTSNSKGIVNDATTPKGMQGKYFGLGSNSSGRSTLQMRQTVNGLPAGTYVVTAIGRAAAGSELTMTVNGYTTTFAACGREGGELWQQADDDEAERTANDGKGYGWCQRSVTFVTDGQPFEVSAEVAGDNNAWADIDGFVLSANGVIENPNTVRLRLLQLMANNNPMGWNNYQTSAQITVSGVYTNKKARNGSVYYSVDGQTARMLTEGIAAGAAFEGLVYCNFLKSASPHTISFYSKDSEGVVSEQVKIEVGSIDHGISIEGLPEVAIYTGEPIEIDGLALKDNRTGAIIPAYSYTVAYKNNTDDGTATVTFAGVFPYYFGKTERTFEIRSHIAADELAVLRQLYKQTQGENKWKRKWDVTASNVRSDALWGVTARNRHITNIDLHGNQLTGSMPAELFGLPELTVLNLEQNQLKDTLFAEKIATKLKEVRLAGNQLTTISGIIPATVEILTLGGQEMNATISLDLTSEGIARWPLQLPNICRFDTQQRNYQRHAQFVLKENSYAGASLLSIGNKDGEWKVETAGTPNLAYNRPPGDTLFCTDDEANKVRVKFCYQMGDANLDGEVDVLDLQTAINVLFDNYKERAYNFYAANLWVDDQINVQDVVRMVDLLMSQAQISADVAKISRWQTEKQAEAAVYVENGKLVLCVSKPVAAFHVSVKGADAFSMAESLRMAGFTCEATHDVNGTVNIVGYSLTQATLPVGSTVLGKIAKGTVSFAKLADEQAHEVKTSLSRVTTGIGKLYQQGTEKGNNLYNMGGQRVEKRNQHHGIYVKKGQKIVK